MTREAPLEKIERRLARFRDPQGVHTMVVCMGKDCVHAGSRRLANLLHDAKGRIRVVKTECLGCCSIAPAVAEDEHLMGCVTVARLKSEVDRLSRS